MIKTNLSFQFQFRIRHFYLQKERQRKKIRRKKPVVNHWPKNGLGKEYERLQEGVRCSIDLQTDTISHDFFLENEGGGTIFTRHHYPGRFMR